jgi:hypothetical protein
MIFVFCIPVFVAALAVLSARFKPNQTFLEKSTLVHFYPVIIDRRIGVQRSLIRAGCGDFPTHSRIP